MPLGMEVRHSPCVGVSVWVHPRVNSSQGLFHLGSMVGVPGRSLGPAPYPGLRSLNCGQNPQVECVPGHLLQDPSVQRVLKSVLQVEVGVDPSGNAAGQGPESSRSFRWFRGKTGRPHTWPADSAVRECPVPPSLMDLITLSWEPHPGTQWGHFSPPCAAWALCFWPLHPLSSSCASSGSVSGHEREGRLPQALTQYVLIIQ